MNKVKSLLKTSPVAVIVASLVIVGVVGAAVVNYLSNAPVADVGVVSPVEMSINPGGSRTELGNKNVTIEGATGLSTVTFTTVAKNNANNSVSGYRVIILEAPADETLTGKEFTKVLFEDKNNEGDAFDIFPMLYAVGKTGTLYKLSEMTSWSYGKMIILFTSTGDAKMYELESGEVDWNDLKVTVGNIVGDYKVSTQYVYDLVDYAAEIYE